jgi:phospholipase/carboxylesterase
MHTKQIIRTGKQTGEATKALVMIHGRGGSAEDILGLATYLPVKDFALFAPQATNNTWYPYSFMAAPKDNEPYLSGALALVKDTVAEVEASGIKPENIYFLGACLTLEFVTRNATRYGGVVAFTGGLIGDKIYNENYSGDFAGTPVFIGTSDPDPHVPVERVNVSADILTGMNAEVTKKIYKGMGHTISQDEINVVSELIFNK